MASLTRKSSPSPTVTWVGGRGGIPEQNIAQKVSNPRSPFLSCSTSAEAQSSSCLPTSSGNDEQMEAIEVRTQPLLGAWEPHGPTSAGEDSTGQRCGLWHQLLPQVWRKKPSQRPRNVPVWLLGAASGPPPYRTWPEGFQEVK